MDWMRRKKKPENKDEDKPTEVEQVVKKLPTAAATVRSAIVATVREARGIGQKDHAATSAYCTLECGGNTVGRTAVDAGETADPYWGQQFKIDINPVDCFDYIYLELRNGDGKVVLFYAMIGSSPHPLLQCGLWCRILCSVGVEFRSTDW